jgi:tripartite-type tricarboxylate transporter receptor subunit TctC
MKKLLAFLLIFCLALAVGFDKLSAAAKSQADKWPEREIRVIIPYKEGGASHQVAMLVKSIVAKEKLLPKPMIVICMPAAATLQGQEEVLKAAPNGYTMLVHHNAMLNNYALGKQKFSYGDFKIVSQVYKTSLAIAARKDAPFNNIPELLDYIKKNPGIIKWTWAGLGGNTHFSSYLFYEKTGLTPGKDIVPMITKGDAESCTSLAGKLADVAIAQPSSMSEFVKAGDFKILGQTSDKTMNMFGKDIKSVKEQGVNFSYNMRVLYFVPKGTPGDIVEKIDGVLAKVAKSPEYIEAMKGVEQDPEYLSSAEALTNFSAENDNAKIIGKKIKEEMQKQQKK